MITQWQGCRLRRACRPEPQADRRRRSSGVGWRRRHQHQRRRHQRQRRRHRSRPAPLPRYNVVAVQRWSVAAPTPNCEQEDDHSRPTTPWVRSVISGVDLMRDARVRAYRGERCPRWSALLRPAAPHSPTHPPTYPAVLPCVPAVQQGPSVQPGGTRSAVPAGPAAAGGAVSGGSGGASHDQHPQVIEGGRVQVMGERVVVPGGAAVCPGTDHMLPIPCCLHCSKESPVERHTYLLSLQERNERLFYYVLSHVSGCVCFVGFVCVERARVRCGSSCIKEQLPITFLSLAYPFHPSSHPATHPPTHPAAH